MPRFAPAALVLALVMSACAAPRQVVRPIPADTPPGRVVEMARAKDEGVKGLRAMVRITVLEDGKTPRGFDGVLYAMRPDSARLTGLAMLGITVFDLTLQGDKFYFYQPSEGKLYTGPSASLQGFLAERGVRTDPDVLFRSLFFTEPGEGEDYLCVGTGDGYDLILVRTSGGGLVPIVKSEYDAGLGLKRKVFYDSMSRPYLTVDVPGYMDVDGFSLPSSLLARDIVNGYSVEVVFEKYLVNPEGMEDDFVIHGGELKGIVQVE